MLDDKKIIIDINNNVQVTGANGQPVAPRTDKRGDIGSALSAQFLVQGGVRLANSLGNQQLSQVLSEGAKYTFLATKIMTGVNPMAMATLGINLAAEAIQRIVKLEKDKAKRLNEVDNARIKAGLLVIGNSQISENWITGRYKYGRG